MGEKRLSRMRKHKEKTSASRRGTEKAQLRTPVVPSENFSTLPEGDSSCMEKAEKLIRTFFFTSFCRSPKYNNSFLALHQIMSKISYSKFLKITMKTNEKRVTFPVLMGSRKFNPIGASIFPSINLFESEMSLGSLSSQIPSSTF